MRFEDLAKPLSGVLSAACAALALLAVPTALPMGMGVAWAQDATAAQPAASLMPDGFGQIVLGMQQDQLRRARPGLEGSPFEGDNKGHPKMLFEKVNSEFIDRVIYLFDDDKPVLSDVIFLKTMPAPDSQRVNAFRAAVLKKWGMPDNVGSLRGDAGEPQAALLWRRTNGVVVASYPTGKAATPGKPVATAVRIGRREGQTDAMSNKFGSLDAGARQKLLTELRDQLVKTPAGVTYR